MRRLIIVGCIVFGVLLLFAVTRPLTAETPHPAPDVVTPSQPLAVCSGGDDCWVSGFHVPGLVGDVYALARDGAKVYVGGNLISAGGLPVSNVAIWDGSRWNDMGGGVSRDTGTAWVYALAVDTDGNVYVGGWFTQAGTGENAVTARNLALWNGSTWGELGGGVNGSVNVIRLTSSTMLIGGSFTQAGSTPVSNIALYYFANSQWDAMGGGVSWDSNYYEGVNAIECVTADCSQLYVGGAFDTAGGVNALCVAYAYRPGATYQWQALNYGLSSGGEVYALLWRDEGSGNFSLYVGGEFGSVGNPPVEAHGIARWDGAQWHALDYGTQGGEGVKALLWDGSSLIAAGNFITVGVPAITANHIARWNGADWSALGSGLGTEWLSAVDALLLDAGGHIVAGGGFEFSGDRVVNNLAAWDGSRWAAFGGGLGVNNTVDTMLADGDSVYVHGAVTRFGPLAIEGLAKLTNVTWNAAEGSPAPFYIRGLTKYGPHFYAGGAFSALNHLAYWNGSTWQTFAGGTSGFVNAVAYDPLSGNLYAAGVFTEVGGGLPASYFAWYNFTWETVPAGQELNGAVRSMVVDAQGNVYVAGDFTWAGDLYVNHIAMWDGSQWHALGGGLSSKDVLALTFDGDGRLYAGGYFANAGGLQVNGVAMWNGLQWAALGSGMDDGVAALAVDPYGQLYAAGDFAHAGGGAANHIARWDGFRWSALGNGTDGNIRALAIVNGATYNRVIAGGYFKTAGDKLSTNIAAYDLPPLQAAPAPTITSISPTRVPSGGTGFWLTVNGENFSSRTYVKWITPVSVSAFSSAAVIPLVTTYISSTQLLAYVPPELTTVEGTVSISTFTPAVEGGGGGEATNPELPVFEVVESYRVFLPLVMR
ncbi:MAG: IPT/TIG domain-containing protein [Anaerolineae bacterium]